MNIPVIITRQLSLLMLFVIEGAALPPAATSSEIPPSHSQSQSQQQDQTSNESFDKEPIGLCDPFTFQSIKDRAIGLWNSSKSNEYVDVKELYDEICSLQTSNANTISHSCFPCDRYQPRCNVFGNCCSSHQLGVGDDDKTSGYLEGVCRPMRVVARSNIRSDARLTVATCPDNFQDNAVRKLCEESSYQSVGANHTIDTVTMVTDARTATLYNNIYCSICNSVNQDTENILNWTLSANCEHHQDIYEAHNDNDLVRLVIAMEHDKPLSDRNCELKYDLPYHKLFRFPVECDPDMYSRELVTSCHNLTGHQDVIGQHPLEQACNSLTLDGKHRILYDGRVYKNIFCALCHKVGSPILCKEDNVTKEQNMPDAMPPFEFLFGYHSDGFQDVIDPSQTQCPVDQWMDPTGLCWKLQCTTGKTLREGACVTSLEFIRGLAYQLDIVLQPTVQSWDSCDLLDVNQTAKNVSNALMEKVIQEVFTPLSITSTTGFVKVRVHIRRTVPCFEKGTTSAHAWINLIFPSNHSLTRDEVEGRLLNEISKWNKINIENEPFPFQFHGALIAQPLLERDERGPVVFELNARLTNDSIICLGSQGCGVTNYTESWLREYSLLYNSHSKPLNVMPHLICPYIEFDRENNITIEKRAEFNTRLKIKFGNHVLRLTKAADLNNVSLDERNKNNSIIRICRDVLEPKLRDAIAAADRSNIVSRLKYFLTLACMAGSFLCLFATVATYSLFPSLRSLAGSNTMGLSSSLMAAQILLLTASYTPGPGILCTVVGAVTHFSWLVMFTWTCLCCVHILRVFTANTYPTSKHNRNTMAITRNVMLSFLIPCLIVLVYVSITYFQHDGERFGYGYRGCTMDTAWAINVPLVIVVSTNIVFFTIVVAKIWQVRHLQGSQNFNKDDKKDMVVYIKLSSLTGMFWLLVVLGEWFKNDVLRCFAIVTNGSQGAFIFISFIFNRRVQRLYAKRFFQNAYSNNTTITSTTTSSTTKTFGTNDDCGTSVLESSRKLRKMIMDSKPITDSSQTF